MPQTIHFNAGQETLAGNIFAPASGDKPQILFMHGAGSSKKERYTWLAEKLLAQNIASLTFDFSGHGESTGLLAESSLQKRSQEALAALKHIDQSNPFTIMGSSMSGFTALDLLRFVQPANLILFCPAIYTAAAYEARFDDGFTPIIREYESWKNADVLQYLERFEGNLLIIIGDQDEVIPPGVIEMIHQHARKTSSKKILTIPGCGHGIQTWLANNPEMAEKVVGEMATILRQNAPEVHPQGDHTF